MTVGRGYVEGTTEGTVVGATARASLGRESPTVDAPAASTPAIATTAAATKTRSITSYCARPTVTAACIRTGEGSVNSRHPRHLDARILEAHARRPLLRGAGGPPADPSTARGAHAAAEPPRGRR